MSRFYRFIFKLGIAVTLVCCFFTLPAYSLSPSDTEIPGGDLFKLGIEKMQHGSYSEANREKLHSMTKLSYY
ncbi:TPR repeat-containing protein [Trichormus variabilis NIES-23]|uniref:TPR repeat-containing protein n=1 Tax=Trichormus variabilis NIES-23 TaxID=1973479 RepID=A0A1Z4KL29_ANAVA|nr:TPR repeat-containing protein [Trichormus variabilis NIES-23]